MSPFSNSFPPKLPIFIKGLRNIPQWTKKYIHSSHWKPDDAKAAKMVHILTCLVIQNQFFSPTPPASLVPENCQSTDCLVEKEVFEMSLISSFASESCSTKIVLNGYKLLFKLVSLQNQSLFFPSRVQSGVFFSDRTS